VDDLVVLQKDIRPTLEFGLKLAGVSGAGSACLRLVPVDGRCRYRRGIRGNGIGTQRDLALRFFSREEIERAERYHRALYWAALAGLALDAGLLAALAWTALGDALDPASLPWWARVPVYAAIVVVSIAVVRTPLDAWAGFTRERSWGLSTQRFSGWAGDRMKGVGVSALFAAAALLLLTALATALPGWWVVPAAAASALLVLLLSFLSPVVLEPLFNHFAPLEDDVLAARLRTLAERARVPVREVLVQDMSRRTRKANAYVSGLGRTRRIVVADTLLEQAAIGELEAVVAHELAHRRRRHVFLGTLQSMAAAVVTTVAVWAVVGSTTADPRRVPLVLLTGLTVTLLSLPLFSAVSRAWERTADGDALELTADPGAWRATFLRLARTNLSDLDPPRLIYLLLFTHPTPPERIAAASAGEA
jgi:STE24 endopeptidase